MLSQFRHLCTQPIQMFSPLRIEYLCEGTSAELPNVPEFLPSFCFLVLNTWYLKIRKIIWFKTKKLHKLFFWHLSRRTLLYLCMFLWCSSAKSAAHMHVYCIFIYPCYIAEAVKIFWADFTTDWSEPKLLAKMKYCSFWMCGFVNSGRTIFKTVANV